MFVFVFFGVLEFGLLYGLVVLGVYLIFWVLDFFDLSVDGSFLMGVVVVVIVIVVGINLWVVIGLVIFVGVVTGWVMVFLSVWCGILYFLVLILIMIVVFFINICIMGCFNLVLLGEDIILILFEVLGDFVLICFFVVVVLVVIFVLLVIWLFNSDFGLGLWVIGVNVCMVVV